MTRRTRIQLTVFAVIGVVMLLMTSVVYLRLPQYLGIGQYDVTADFADTSGLYANALVSYKGADVGRVRGLDLRADGVTVRMSIDDDRDLPANVRARIRSTSAVGEQYVELVPTGTPTGRLGDGDRIERDRTDPMPAIGPLFESIDSLVRSIPKDDLRGLLDDVAVAFGDSGEDLGVLLDSSRLLLTSATENLDPTTALIRDLVPVLGTQVSVADATTAYARDLALFTRQLGASDADVLRLLQALPPAAAEIEALEKVVAPTLPVLLANLSAVGQVTSTYLPGIRQTLVIYPALVADLISVVRPFAGLGAVPLDFRLNLNDPPPCTQGFLPLSQRRDPSETSLVPTPPGLYCKLPPEAAADVRGARNLPCPDGSGRRAATPAACGVSTGGRRGAGAITPPGDLLGSGRSSYLVSPLSDAREGGAQTWQSLILQPTR